MIERPLLQPFLKMRSQKYQSYIPYFREQFPRKLFFFESVKCENFTHYGNFLLHKLNMQLPQKLLKRGNYSKEENIRGNTICTICNTQLKNAVLQRKLLNCTIKLFFLFFYKKIMTNTFSTDMYSFLCLRIFDAYTYWEICPKNLPFSIKKHPGSTFGVKCLVLAKYYRIY